MLKYGGIRNTQTLCIKQLGTLSVWEGLKEGVKKIFLQACPPNYFFSEQGADPSQFVNMYAKIMVLFTPSLTIQEHNLIPKFGLCLTSPFS